MNKNYTKLAPATVALLATRATEGYFTSRGGFSDFVNALSTIPFNNDPEAVIIREPLGKPTLVNLAPQALEAYTTTAKEYLLPSSDDPASLVLNNIPTGFLTPVIWPTAFPSSIMEHLPPLQPPKSFSPQSPYQRYFMSSKAAQNLATMAGLLKPTPQKLSIFVNDVLAHPHRQYIDNRPPSIVAQSETNRLLGLPSIWFEPLIVDFRLHLQLTPETQETLIHHARNLNIQARQAKHSTTATISAFLEAIGQDYLRWN